MPGSRVPEFRQEAGQERPAAINIDDRRKREEHETIAPKPQRIAEPQPVLDHRRQDQDWRR